ncbi:hypothetical protein [Aeromonas sp. MrichA-1]|uniref:hypothetical protein n=1 Tax=Aeromonas sp. MrichA-1 TaxID=2823362 RepID=UPI001B3418FF|nr:hypothetical protein [Aeromonas sp. MrichA-1]MBP4081946.1 hypothetical protein [Aeromonas sp. MrichA-1]
MWWSYKYMLCLWVGCVVMGAFYLVYLWDGKSPVEFIIGQIVLGLVGAAREMYLKKYVLK